MHIDQTLRLQQDTPPHRPAPCRDPEYLAALDAAVRYYSKSQEVTS